MGVELVLLKYCPQLLTDNGLCHISKRLAECLGKRGSNYTKRKPSHLTMQKKIKRYNRSMKSLINIEKYYFS